MGVMKTLRPHDSLQDGWEPSPAPYAGPDGLLVGPPSAPTEPPYPSLCEAGPCKHFHRVEIQVEAENPLAQRIEVPLPDGLARVESTPGGKVYRPLPVFHTSVTRACYPDVGIEIELRATPVVRCNRFEPRNMEHWTSGVHRGGVSGTPRKELYAQQVRDWHDARAHAQREAEEAERAIAEAEALHTKGDTE